MKRQQWLVFSVVMLLVGSSGAFLNKLQASYRLSQPGLKLVGEPVYVSDGVAEWLVCTNTIDLPARVLDYRSEPLEVTFEEWDYLPIDTTYGRRRYKAKNGSWIDISIVLMGRDRTSIHKPEICLYGQGWKVDQSELVTVPMTRPASYDLPVMKLTASKSFTDANGKIEPYRALFVYWFVSDRRLTARHGERMWWMAKDLLSTGVLSRWAYIAYFAVCRPGEEEPTFALMKKLITASVPEFQLVPGPGEASPHPEGTRRP
ncbi:MAG: exosortase-associated EpsI family protein [Verrucomicrobia bacterium]|nr:exosortase-associated EpsI family protein [Verrucomicrobiota bacterium]